MKAKGMTRLLVVVLCACLAGCATSRSELHLKSPMAAAAASSVAPENQHVVVIRSIIDERVFEEAPSEPSTPSLGSGGAAKASDAVKARAIARKRNGFGQALGDVLLEQGQTVEGVLRENLTLAFQQAGYSVRNEADAGASPIVVDVHIKQFWAWFQPGFWAITLNNNITTDLVVEGASPVVVSTHVEDSRQAATEGAWLEIVGKGLDAYRAEVTSKTKGKF